MYIAAAWGRVCAGGFGVLDNECSVCYTVRMTHNHTHTIRAGARTPCLYTWALVCAHLLSCFLLGLSAAAFNVYHFAAATR
jgi:hypothetical protein